MKSGCYWAACTRCCSNTRYKTWYRRGLMLFRCLGDNICCQVSVCMVMMLGSFYCWKLDGRLGQWKIDDIYYVHVLKMNFSRLDNKDNLIVRSDVTYLLLKVKGAWKIATVIIPDKVPVSSGDWELHRDILVFTGTIGDIQRVDTIILNLGRWELE